MILMIDNYDSFVYNLVQYFGELNAEITVIRNDSITIKQATDLAPTHLVISPGPRDPSMAGISLDMINYFKGKIPILGVCLGHQAIGQAFGAKIVRAGKPVHGKKSLVYHDGSGIFANLPSPLTVGRYHSLAIDRSTLPPCLKITAQTADGEIMGVHHTEYAIYGIQFHPESILTQSGHAMLQNFLEIT